VNCVICGIRKPRRHCPGVRGDICTLCCGTGREESIDCPLDCTYLHDAHLHEKPPEFDSAKFPNQDIQITEEFLRTNEILMAFIATAVYEGALEVPGCTDYDVREALESLVKTYRTLNAGLYYDSLPVNPFAAAMVNSVQTKLAEIKKRETEAAGSSSIRDATVLGVLAFLQRLEYGNNNGRRRSRAFIDFIGRFYIPIEGAADDDSPEPDEPRVIL
jgi:hypothetical protein